jgi:hypothetical protein
VRHLRGGGEAAEGLAKAVVQVGARRSEDGTRREFAEEGAVEGAKMRGRSGHFGECRDRGRMHRNGGELDEPEAWQDGEDEMVTSRA